MDLWIILGIVSLLILVCLGLILAKFLKKEKDKEESKGHLVPRNVKFNCSGNKYCCVDDSKLVAMYTFQKLTDKEEAREIKQELTSRGLVEKSDPDSPVVMFEREDVSRDDT